VRARPRLPPANAVLRFYCNARHALAQAYAAGSTDCLWCCAQASDSPPLKPTSGRLVTANELFSEKRAENLRPRSLADLLEFGFLFRSDLACVFECLDALRGELLAVVPHAKR
jgi:hypothetical protein